MPHRPDVTGYGGAADGTVKVERTGPLGLAATRVVRASTFPAGADRRRQDAYRSGSALWHI